MKLGRALFAVCLVLGSLVTGVVWGAKGPGTFGFNYPGYSTQWHKGEGVPDSSKSQQALHLEKVEVNLPEENKGAGVFISGFEGAKVSELGFDVRRGELCASAVTFHLETQEGVKHAFECSTGLSSPSPDDPANWTRVRFPQAIGWTVVKLKVVFLLPTQDTGFTHLDNIDVNGVLIGKPGRN